MKKNKRKIIVNGYSRVAHDHEPKIRYETEDSEGLLKAVDNAFRYVHHELVQGLGRNTDLSLEVIIIGE